jgi:hypothetical protein
MADGIKQKFPRWWQGLIILVSGIVIGLSSCAAFLTGANFNGRGSGNQSLASIFAIGFFAGLAMALVGFVLMLIGIARAVVNSLKPPAPPSLMQPGVPVVGAGRPAFGDLPEQRILRQFQIVLVVFMLIPAASIATSVLVLLARPNAWNSLVLIVISYALSQLPYGFALARTRRGLDRLGIAVAFAASCVMVVEGFLPLLHVSAMFAVRQGLFGWPSLFLIGHVVVAVYAWRAGQLAPADGDDMALIAGSFVGVVAYVIFIRFFEMHFIRIFLR